MDSPESREAEFKDENIQLKRDAEGVDSMKVKETERQRVARKLRYYAEKYEKWLQISRKINR